VTILHSVRQFALKLGIELNRYNPAQSQRARMLKLLAHHGIDTVLDVGANDGGYGRLVREVGFRGDILSFEPLADAHRKLTASAQGDERWFVAPRMALGSEDGEIEINVAGNSTSSSVLAMHEQHVKAAPDSEYVGLERVPLRRLDSVSHQSIDNGSAIFLKIDTQGYEVPVLEGAESLLPRLRGIQLELSLVPLYEGQVLFRDVIDLLYERQFALWNVIPGFMDHASGRMLQMDGVFFRSQVERGN
jgi:FkbM family methyltransferase